LILTLIKAIAQWFRWTTSHVIDSSCINDYIIHLYDVILLCDFPRKNLRSGRYFKHVMIDSGLIVIHYENNKSCGVKISEIQVEQQ